MPPPIPPLVPHVLSSLWPYLFSSLSLIFSEFFFSVYSPLLSFLFALTSVSFCLSCFFFHQETILVVLKFFGLQSIFETSKNVEKTLHSSMVRESKEISQEVDSFKTVWNFLNWQIYYYEMITDCIWKGKKRMWFRSCPFVVKKQFFREYQGRKQCDYSLISTLPFNWWHYMHALSWGTKKNIRDTAYLFSFYLITSSY